ncbi:MAG TPA: PD-(D/E)XK nuclease family protein [Solirubrobacteraceae bacterium]|jgi:DNA helicase-2/ATP-dependent DNA helicase PcrA
MPLSRIVPATPADDSTPLRPRADKPPADGAAAASAGEVLAEERGAAAFRERAEVRDVLAWMRLLADPHDAAAVVRALARPPIELRQVDLARVIALARRRKLDMVAALAAAIESPQIPPAARERVGRFLELRRAAAEALDAGRPDLLARVVLGAEGQDRAEVQPRDGRRREDEALQEMLRMMREEVLASVARIGGRLGELRLDTDLDISHGVVRYLELLKLSALAQRPAGQDLVEALGDINARLLAATTSLQREIFQTSALDELLSERPPGAEHDADGAGGGDERGEREDDDARARALARVVAPREASSLGPFLPRKGSGLALSASDVETYRGCPLRYKYARVLRIPTEQTQNQRFGIVVHQVLERFHSGSGETLPELLELLEQSWRRSGFGTSDEHERELYGKARAALTRYHERLHGQDSEPVWFERPFSFRLGPHHLRGRVDRVDRLGGADGEEYELIDYKTSRPKSAEQLGDDVQLSLYALAARDSWGLEASRQAYYYVLDDLKVPVPRDDRDAEAVKEIVLAAGEGILAQSFEPTPSLAACSLCDYRIVCPAAER